MIVLNDEQVQMIKEKLDNIIRKKGPYNLDQLTHAGNVINSNSELASDILKILEKTKNNEVET